MDEWVNNNCPATQNAMGSTVQGSCLTGYFLPKQ